MDHLERFEDLISAIKVNRVPEDYLLCKLFKYSLAGEALHWLKQLPPGALTSWADIKNAFLRNFFDEAHAEDLRSKISTFKPYNNNYIINNNMSYENSSYQKPPPHTQESKIEAMLDRVFEGQHSMTVDFNGKIDSIYNNLNTKFETLSTHVKKLEIQVVQT
uniref:Retrotransposon gag domain-containing protein n=1 Tax=Brassica campestris TaxID=3711 RepID=M4F770_BRACM